MHLDETCRRVGNDSYIASADITEGITEAIIPEDPPHVRKIESVPDAIVRLQPGGRHRCRRRYGAGSVEWKVYLWVPESCCIINLLQDHDGSTEHRKNNLSLLWAKPLTARCRLVVCFPVVGVVVVG